MAGRFDPPPNTQGDPIHQIKQLHSYLFCLAEKLNVELDALGKGGSTENGDSLGAGRYKELREMLGKSTMTQGENLGAEAKRLEELIKLRVTLADLSAEVEAALQVAKDSGQFDGNGIASATMANSILTLNFTNGTKFTSPSLKGDNFSFAVGDVFVTSRSGNPSSLLGYGSWEQIETSPVNMWKRTA